MYLKNDTLFLAGFSKNFRKMCTKICHLDPAKFLSDSRKAWEGALKKTKVKLELLTDIDVW